MTRRDYIFHVRSPGGEGWLHLDQTEDRRVTPRVLPCASTATVIRGSEGEVSRWLRRAQQFLPPGYSLTPVVKL